jgi:RecA-family ATPase
MIARQQLLGKLRAAMGKQVLSTYHLACWLAGGSDEDYAVAVETWPDLPTTRRDANSWLKKRPDLLEVVAKVDTSDDAPSVPPLAPYLLTADELLTTEWPEPVWAIPNLLPAGLTILAGKPKVGKSWLALQLAQSIATGGVAFNQTVERGPTLYLALEDPPRRLAERMKSQCWPLGTDADFMTIGDFADRVGDLRNGGGENLAEQMEARAYRYVAIDTLSRSVRGDQSDVDKMTLALSPLQEAAHSSNCAVLMVDHHRKGFGADPDAITDILGSTAKGALADNVWGLYRERGKVGANLQIVGREIAERTLALTFDTLTGCWQSEGEAYELEMTERRQEIIEALEAMGKSSLADIADYVEQPKSNTHSRLQDLAAAGKVLRSEEGQRVFYTPP